ncbi:MAG: hypothetical protein WCS69_05625 [Ignavibacteriaceae bacterium]|jgi:hypothetical protein
MKMKYNLILCYLLLGLALLNGQENSNVELPQFVITGKEAYEFPLLEKQKPGLVSTVSGEFFKPVYSADELEVKDFSEPTRRSGEFLDSIRFVNGEADFLIGNNILPSLSATYRLPLERSLFSANINAFNQRAYLTNADRNKFGAKLFYNYIISDSSGFLAFSKFHASGKVENESYKLFASPVPNFNRQFLRSNFVTSLQNISSKTFNYDLTVEDYYLNMKYDSLKENIIKVNGFSKYTTGSFDISLFGKVSFLSSIYNTLLSENSNIIQAKGIFGYPVENYARLNIGFEYSKMDSYHTFYPYLSAEVQWSKGFSLFIEYHPTSTLLTQQDFLETNRYYAISPQVKYIFYSVASQFSLNTKYEYEKIFEVSGGLGYCSASNYPYFSDSTAGRNIYNVNVTEAKSTSVFASIHLYPGEFGFFAGEINYQHVTNESGNSVPNVSPVKLNLTYGLFVTPEISLSAKMMYYSPAFLNFANTEKRKEYFNLTLNGEMNISENMFAQLEVQNILNQKNEIWKNYQELPLSIAAGLKIIW